jgi:hypothetical protein
MDQNANMMIIRIMSFKTIAANLIQGLSKVEQVLNSQTFLPSATQIEPVDAGKLQHTYHEAKKKA